jgi:hypothetical protein
VAASGTLSETGGASVNEAIGAAAAATGYALRVVLYLLGWVPVVAGPLLVLWGTWQIYPPAMYILAGLAICVLTLLRANPGRAAK